MPETLRVRAILTRSFGSWTILVDKPHGSGYTKMIEEPNASAERVIEVADALGPDVGALVRAELAELAKKAETELTEAHRRAARDEQNARESIAHRAVEARVARDIADRYPPPPETDIPF